MINFLLINYDIILPLLTLLICVRNLRYNKHVAALLIVHEVISLYSYFLAEEDKNNIFCYQILIFVSVFIIILYYNPKLLPLCLLTFFAFDYDTNQTFNLISWSVGAFTIVFLCVQYLYKRVKYVNEIKEPKFFITGGLLFYYVGSFKVWEIFTYRNKEMMALVDYWYWSAFIYLVMCVWFVVGMKTSNLKIA